MIKHIYICTIFISLRLINISCYAQNNSEHHNPKYIQEEFFNSMNAENSVYLLVSYLENFYDRYNCYPDDKDFLFKDLANFSVGSPYQYIESLLLSQQNNIDIKVENNHFSLILDTIPLITFEYKKEDLSKEYSIQYYCYNYCNDEGIYHLDKTIQIEDHKDYPIDKYLHPSDDLYSFYDADGLYIFDKMEITNSIKAVEDELILKLWPESIWDRMFESIDCECCITYKLTQWTRYGGLCRLVGNDTISSVVCNTIDKTLRNIKGINRAFIPAPIRTKAMPYIYQLKNFMQESMSNGNQLLRMLSQCDIKHKYCNHVLDKNILQIEFNKIDTAAFAVYKKNIRRYEMRKDIDGYLHIFYDGIEILVSKPYSPIGVDVTASNDNVKMYDHHGLFVGADTSSELLFSLFSLYQENGIVLSPKTYTENQFYDDYTYSLMYFCVERGECTVIFGSAPCNTIVNRAIPILKDFCDRHNINGVIFPLINGE